VKLKTACLAMLVFLSLVPGRAESAQEVQLSEPAWQRQMYAEGWRKTQEGVLRRDVGGGRFETFGYGAEGFQWLIETYSRQLTYFEGKYREYPTDELASLIDRLREKIDALQDEILAAPAAASFDDGSQLAGCSFSYDATAYAGPLTSTQGVTATASAYFHGTCGTGKTYAYAYAHAAEGSVATTHYQEDPKQGAWVDSYATASVNGSSECESRAQASVEGSAPYFFYATPEEINTQCPPASQPLAASISGPATVTTDFYGPTCVNVTWTANPTGGHPGYTYNWYLGTGTGTAIQGTGPTFTQSVCSTSQPVTLEVVDSDGQTVTAPFTTNVQYRAAIVAQITGPTTVSTNSTTPCANVTWTASASGSGHSGFTYKWYLGTSTSTTVQGTGATFTKSYCNTTQTVKVTLLATASDGHWDDVTFTTNITYTPPSPLSASISGSSSVGLLPGACRTLTWTANVSGGTPAYTYSWTIGTSTTVLSTASTLTKQYCAPQTVNVKLTVRDAASQTANATFTTTIFEKEPVCTGGGCP
jgi:hypothetical protein